MDDTPFIPFTSETEIEFSVTLIQVFPESIPEVFQIKAIFTRSKSILIDNHMNKNEFGKSAIKKLS